MSILIDDRTRILVQGLTGGQASVDAERAVRYGSCIVASVTPGKGGERIHGIPIFDTVAEAVAAHPMDASVIYAPPLAVKWAALETIAAGIDLVLITAEGVPLHDVAIIVAAASRAGVTLIGCNTNGIISPGKARLGGIGGVEPDEIYARGTIGICSRSGGMSAEIAMALRDGGLGVSTCVSMGGDQITGSRMADVLALFERDPETDGIVLFGEPGTQNEQEVAALVSSGRVTKPVAALIAGAFQERYPPGRSFGHAAAIVLSEGDTVSAKKRVLREAGVFVAERLSDIPSFLGKALGPRGERRHVEPRIG